MTGERRLLSGDEAVALAALHAGVRWGRVIPARRPPKSWKPSTNSAAAPSGRRTRRWRWRSGSGAAFAGARAIVTMKHVGLNVAADPLFTAAYTGVDRRPGASSRPTIRAWPPARTSRTTAATRVAAGVPMLEPTDSQEAYDFTWLGHRDLRALEDPGAPAHDHARLPRQDGGASARGARASPGAELRARHPGARDDPGLRPARPPAAAAEAGRDRGLERDRGAEPARSWATPTWGSSPPASRPSMPARPRRRPLS